MAEDVLADVIGGAQRDYHQRRELRGQIADRSMSGDTLLTETIRGNFANDNRITGAVVAQALLGEDPVLANSALADNFSGGQPWTARPAPQPAELAAAAKP